MSLALRGLRMLELGEGIAPAYCGRLLRDLGAEVTKVEVAHGDRTRQHADGLLFETLNEGKAMAALADGGGLPPDAGSYDIVVEGLTTPEAESLEPEFRSWVDGGTIVASVSTFGRSGPLAGRKGFALQAATGTIAYRMGQPTREPVVFPLEAPDYTAGAVVSNGILLAILARRRGGAGRRIDVATIEMMDTYFNRNGSRGTYREVREGHRSSRLYPYVTLRCKDGYVCVATLQKRHWDIYVEAMGHPELVHHSRYDVLGGTLSEEVKAELDAMQEEWFKDTTKAELFEFFRRIRVPFHPVHTMSELLASDHLEQRRFFRDLEHEDGPPLRVPGPPFRRSDADEGEGGR